VGVEIGDNGGGSLMFLVYWRVEVGMNIEPLYYTVAIILKILLVVVVGALPWAILRGIEITTGMK
jgi:hypothetical protein